MDDRVIIDDDSERITEPDKIIENDLVVLEDDNSQVQAFIRSNFTSTIKVRSGDSYRIFAQYANFALAVGVHDKKAFALDLNYDVFPWLLPLNFKCAIRHKSSLEAGFYRMDNGEIREYNGAGSYRYLHDSSWLTESEDVYDGKLVRMRLEAESEQEES